VRVRRDAHTSKRKKRLGPCLVSKLLHTQRNHEIGSGNNGCSATKAHSNTTPQPVTSSKAQQQSPPNQFPEQKLLLDGKASSSVYIEKVPEFRLLPLISSATEIVHALGLGKFQVGRSHECDFPAEVKKLPICTRPAIPVDGSSAEIDALVKDRLRRALSVYDVDARMIRELGPTHIITQTQCEVCAVSLADVERALQNEFATKAKVISLQPYALADVWADIRRVAQACDDSQRGEQVICELQKRMTNIQQRAKQAQRHPTVAAIEWLEPLMAGGNWVPELIEMGNGHNLFGLSGQHSPWMPWEQLVQANPDVIAILPCGFDIPRTRTEMHWLTDRAQWGSLAAVRQGNVFVCDGNQFMNRPGPRLVESLQIFAEILHPQLFPPMLEGTGWERFTG
jgi:iron complex transport system substrate-binding protein